ncbi:MAG TPA: 1-(5-phosphoribosyl)-5-[(5-phosphoribosylamino)methylideneamino]imidazole-4-carboxamide isomerase [Candidatus Binatia bacterium]|nr:1-(5-phosphoribosyl)-5-[(5-phosphoribosylamino)methylideneamino]imidazole-4-carboxamide isomerase [Candidatus Binatia bacterium]
MSERSFEAIPAIDLRGGRCVRLVQGDFAAETAYGDDPVAMAERWAGEGATRLHVVDLDGAARGARAQGSLIARICAALAIPVQVGGGLRDLDALASVLDAGAERAILGTAAALDPTIAERACARWPGRIAVGIDLRDGRVAIEGWLRDAAAGADEVAARADAAGAAAIVLTDVRRDGTGVGANLDATVDFAARHPTPVIVSGGVGSVDDVRRARAAFDRGANLAGVIVGRALYEGRVRLADAVAAAAGEG